MDRITCDIIRDLLPLYIDEVCSAGSRALVEEHLQNCRACKAEYEAVSKREFFMTPRRRRCLMGCQSVGREANEKHFSLGPQLL